jgi:hypothetical protein
MGSVRIGRDFVSLFVSMTAGIVILLLVGGIARPAFGSQLPDLKRRWILGSAVGSQPPDLKGKWTLNHDRSENASEKAREAMSDRGRFGGIRAPGGMGRSGSGRPGGTPPISGGSPPYGGSGGRTGQVDEEEAEARHKAMSVLFEAPETVEIAQDGSVITIKQTTEADKTEVRSISPDGKPVKQESDSGAKQEVTAKWRGNKLVLETKTDRGRITETFELASDGRELNITTKVEDSRLPKAVSIKRVYDTAKAE